MRKGLFKFILLYSVPVLFLSSCGPINNPEPTFYEDMTMLESYYKKYVLPKNPDATLMETKYYQFLLKFVDNDRYNAFFVAWEVDKSSEQWNLEISGNTYAFEHQILFLIYRSGKDSFVSPQESIDEGILSIQNLVKSFEKMSEFISYS